METQEVIIKTKKIQSYFRGEIRKDYFPLDGSKFHIECKSYSGGAHKSYSILDVMDFKADSKEEIVRQLKSFSRKNKLVLEFPKPAKEKAVKPVQSTPAVKPWQNITAQENIARLPAKCLGILPATGEVIWIVAGELGFYPLSQTKQDEIRLVKKTKFQTNSEFCDMMNERDGITKAQRKAMEWGSMFGWAHGLAMPEHYNEKGEIIKEFSN